MKRKKCKYTGKYHTLCTEEQENPQKYVFKPENDDGMTSLKSWKKNLSNIGQQCCPTEFCTQQKHLGEMVAKMKTLGSNKKPAVSISHRSTLKKY